MDIPQFIFIQSSEHEELREWVLAVSVDENVKKELKRDKRGAFEASLIDQDRVPYQPCIITGMMVKIFIQKIYLIFKGYPILGSLVQIGHLSAEKDHLNTFLILIKVYDYQLVS